MDPITASGIALSVAGLAGQVFAGCIQCLQLIITARDLPKDSKYLVLRLRMEQQRLFAWSEASGLLDHDPNNADQSKVLESNVFGLHRSTVLELLVQIKVLFEDFEKHQKRDKRLDARRADAKHNPDSHDEASDTMSALTPRRKAYIESAMKKWAKRSHEGVTRLRWVAFDKTSFEGLLQKFSTLNDNMTGLLDVRLQNEIFNITQDTNRGVLQLAHDLADLQQLVKATLVLTMQNQPPLQTTLSRVPEPENEKASGLQLLAQLARFKAFNQTVEMGSTDNSVLEGLDISQIDTGSIRLDKSSISISKADLTSEDIESCRSAAVYTKSNGIKQDVWIEWKEYDWQRPGQPAIPPLILERVQNLTQLLHHRPKPRHFRVPHCIGYFDNASHDDNDELDDDDDFRIGFVFEKPEDVEPSALPISLLELLRNHRKPRVTERIALAQAIATCILYLHSVNWLHKGLRSHNIVFFKTGNESAATNPVNYAAPYLSGFDFARPARPEEQTEIPGASFEHDIYRHPSTQSNGLGPRESFRKSFDIYSLGVILVELAYWKPVDQILDINCRAAGARAQAAAKVRGRLLRQDNIDEVGACMGEVYERVTTKCLAGGKELGIETGEDEIHDQVAARLSRTFYDEVVQKLADIRV